LEELAIGFIDGRFRALHEDLHAVCATREEAASGEKDALLRGSGNSAGCADWHCGVQVFATVAGGDASLVKGAQAGV
jgi:hypothetical protein